MSTLRHSLKATASGLALAGVLVGGWALANSGDAELPRIGLPLPAPLNLESGPGRVTVIESSFGPSSEMVAMNTQLAQAAPAEAPSASQIFEGQGTGRAPARPKTGLVRPEVPATVEGLRIGRAGERTRIIVELTGSTDFAYSVGPDGQTVSLILPAARWKTAPTGSTKSGGRISGYTYEPHPEGGGEMKIHATAPVDVVAVEPMPPSGGEGYRLIVDLVDVTPPPHERKGGLTFWESKEQPAAAPPPPAPAPKVAEAPPRPAPTPVKPEASFDGFYVGFQGGYGFDQMRENHSGRGKKSTLLKGGEGGVMAGYGATFANIYVGAEIEGSLADENGKVSVANGKHEYQKEGSYGATLRVGGAVMDRLLLYGRLGYQRAHFDLSSNRPSDVPASSVSSSKALNGILFGLGADYLLSDNWVVRADYGYTVFSEWKYTDSANGIATIKPRENLVRLGVAYKF